MAPRKIIIDTDPGQDDAAAIMLALASPELDVLGITAVAGNVPLHLTERNARKICELAGKPETPFHVQRNLVCALILVAVGFIAYSLRMWLLMQFHQATWTVPAMLLAVGIIYGVWYRLTYWVIAKMRVLALFMAFTDEFVEE